MDYIITQALKEYEESKKPITITFVKIGKDILLTKKSCLSNATDKQLY